MSNTLGFVLIFLTDKSFVISTRFIVCYFIVDVFIVCSVSVLGFLSAIWILHIISSINFTISNLHVDLFYHINIIFFLSILFLLTFSTTSVSVSVFLSMPFRLSCSTTSQANLAVSRWTHSDLLPTALEISGYQFWPEIRGKLQQIQQLLMKEKNPSRSPQLMMMTHSWPLPWHLPPLSWSDRLISPTVAAAWAGNITAAITQHMHMHSVLIV